MNSEVAFEIPLLLRVYKDGQIERLGGNEIVPPSLDPNTGVESKDITISSEINLSARLYIPKITNPFHQKLPLLVYFHGGGFCIETAFSPTYHNYLNLLVSEANIVVVSVNYRRAPEHLLPIAYEDSWAAIKWVNSHCNQKGPEEWLNNYANFESVFFSGDSAGATIAHNMGIRVGTEEGFGGGDFNFKLVGMVLVHPYFCGKEAISGEVIEKKEIADNLWNFVCPNSSNGCDDPLINPAADSRMARLGCRKVLVCVAEKDLLRERDLYYCESLRNSGWGGEVEILEAEGEEHVFHLFKPTCEKAVAMLKKVASFMNE